VPVPNFLHQLSGEYYFMTRVQRTSGVKKVLGFSEFFFFQEPANSDWSDDGVELSQPLTSVPHQFRQLFKALQPILTQFRLVASEFSFLNSQLIQENTGNQKE